MPNAVKYPLVLALVCLVSAGALSVTFRLTAGRIAENEARAYEKALRVALPHVEDVAEERFFETRETVDGDGTVTGFAVTALSMPAEQARRECSRDPKRCFSVVTGKDAQQGIAGYATVGTAQGYSSLLRVMVGFTPDARDRRIVAIRVLFQQETPGLGANCAQVRSDKTLWSALFGSSEPQSDGEDRPWFQAQFDGKRVSDLKAPIKKLKDKGVDAITGATITSEAVRIAILEASGRLTRSLEAEAAGRP